jgi:glycerol-3-phosphate dehydrogenase (NAD(P)+)
MGATLAHAIATGGRTCALWCSDPASAEAVRRDRRHPARPRYELSPDVAATHSLEEAVSGASLVVVSVPSPAFRDTARALGPLLDPAQVLLSSTKGIELPGLATMSELLRECTGATAVGAIAGPNITPEIMSGQLTPLLIASPSREARELAEQVFSAAPLQVHLSDDLRSVELAGVLKNVVSIALGIGLGRGMGWNAQGLLFARGLQEIGTLMGALGADPAVLQGMAGVGDIFLTACSPQSLNRTLGMELGRGIEMDKVVGGLPEVPEGIGAVRGARLLARRLGLSLPVCEATAEILEGEAPADALERVLMELPERSCK